MVLTPVCLVSVSAVDCTEQVLQCMPVDLLTEPQPRAGREAEVQAGAHARIGVFAG